MKRTLYISAVLAALCACSGTVDPEAGNPGEDIPEEFTAPYTLSADKEEVEASGTDLVTFSLRDAYGREMLTDKKTLQSVNIVSEEGVRVPRMSMTATFIENGTYNFSATFKGEKTENTIQIKAVNRGKYEKFHRNIGLFKCTSVWCVACPGLDKALHGLAENTQNHIVVLACHGNFNYTDPFSLYVGDYDLGTYMMAAFGGNGWPTLIYDLETAEVGAAGTSDLENNIMKRRVSEPSTCGIKVSSVSVEGSSLKVRAAVKSSTGGSYDLACAVLRDGLVYNANGVYSANDDGVYDNVVLNVTSNFIRYSADSGKELNADEEFEREFSFDFGEGNVPSEDVLKGYYVAVYAHRKTEDSSVMDNIVTCAYGESVDYVYNE